MIRYRTRCRLYQGCGVGVETGVGVGRSRQLWPESESELEPGKFCRLRLRPGVAGYHPSTDGDFGRKHWKTGRKGEWQCGDKVERHLVIEFGLKRVPKIILGHHERCVNWKTVIRTTFKGISDNHGRMHPQLARTGAVLPITRLDAMKSVIKKMVASYCSF